MWCHICQHNLPSSFFYDHARVNYKACKACHSAKRRARLADPSFNAAADAKRRAERLANPQPFRDKAKERRLANIERERELDRKYAAQNAERKRKAAAEWRRLHPDKEKQMKVQYREANLASVIARNKQREAAKLRATPKWFDQTAAALVYRGAKQLEQIVGIKMHVDHIVPLRSRIVCGLHWHGNLQVVAQDLNLRKLNHHWPDQP